MIQFGTDPEVFVTYEDNKDYDTFIEGVPFCIPPVVLEETGVLTPIGGNIKHPIYYSDDEFNIIADGAALEVNLNRGYSDPLEMRSAIHRAVKCMDSLVGDTDSITILPTVNFDYKMYCPPESLRNERYYMGVNFGCDPDIDAFNVDWTAEVIDATKHPLRYGGGHIHFSGEEFGTYPHPAAKLLALTVGNFVVSKTGGELEQKRAMYYGKPGKYRETQYGNINGVEYRTPSNGWLLFTEDEYLELFDWAYRALHLLKKSIMGKKMLERFSDRTIKAISNANSLESSEILMEVKQC